MAGINPGGTPAEHLEVQRDVLIDKAREACQTLADALGTLDYLEWWNSVPDEANFTEIEEMATQALPDCTCNPVDDIACLACIEQARRRYGSEIPYNFTAGDVGSSDSGSLSDVASEASIAGSGALVTGIELNRS